MHLLPNVGGTNVSQNDTAKHGQQQFGFSFIVRLRARTLGRHDLPKVPINQIGGAARGFSRADVDRRIACIQLKANAPTASIRAYKLTFNGVDLLTNSLGQAVASVSSGACLDPGLASGTYPVMATVTTTDG